MSVNSTWRVRKRDTDTHTNARAHRDTHSDRDAPAHGDADTCAVTHRHRDEYTQAQRNADTRAYAYFNSNRYARGTQPDAERGANLRGDAGQSSGGNLCAVSATGDRIEMGL